MKFEECEGIVVRQSKTLKSRRMILMITDCFGKISAGTSLSESSKSKAALSLRPYTVGKYQLTKRSGFINIKDGETIKSYYDISENYDKFLNVSLSLELTAKSLPENAPAPKSYALLCEYLDAMLVRNSSFTTLTDAYIVRLLAQAGVLPDADDFMSVELLRGLDSDIVKVLVFLRNNPLKRVEKLALDNKIATELLKFLLRYSERHLDIGTLKCALPNDG